MRIIKNPNPVEEKEKKCESCGCIFAFTEGDIKNYTYSNNILGPGYYGYRKRYVLCPNCGKKIVLEEKSTDGRDSMIDPSMITIDFEKSIKEGEIVPEGEEIIQYITNSNTQEDITTGPDIEELTVFPHLENPEEDGE